MLKTWHPDRRRVWSIEPWKKAARAADHGGRISSQSKTLWLRVFGGWSIKHAWHIRGRYFYQDSGVTPGTRVKTLPLGLCQIENTNRLKNSNHESRAMHKIDRDDLKAWMERQDDDFVLVETAGRAEYDQGHLPGAVNLPPEDAHFEETAARLLPDRDKSIVVYCASVDCTTSEKAGQRLESLGYRQVYNYEGGKRDWRSVVYQLVPSHGPETGADMAERPEE